MGYHIRINYVTGDSFHTETRDSSIGEGWTLEVAKENLRRLREHHRAVNISKNYYSMANHAKVENLSTEWKKQPWYVGVHYSNGKETINETSFMIVNNDGTPKKEYAFWNGYFEHLNSATVEAETVNDDNDMHYAP